MWKGKGNSSHKRAIELWGQANKLYLTSTIIPVFLMRIEDQLHNNETQSAWGVFELWLPYSKQTISGQWPGCLVFITVRFIGNTLSFTLSISVLGSQSLLHFSWLLLGVNTANPRVTGPGDTLMWAHVSLELNGNLQFQVVQDSQQADDDNRLLLILAE